jgi:hypothetical protein
VGPRRPGDEVECVRRLKAELAFKMLRSGHSDLIPHALQLLPTNKVILLYKNLSSNEMIKQAFVSVLIFQLFLYCG